MGVREALELRNALVSTLHSNAGGPAFFKLAFDLTASDEECDAASDSAHEGSPEACPTDTDGRDALAHEGFSVDVCGGAEGRIGATESTPGLDSFPAAVGIEAAKTVAGIAAEDGDSAVVRYINAVRAKPASAPCLWTFNDSNSTHG